ncbi:MAG TPA: GntR family transcriptional regulator [Longimicrobiales bacterium]
MSARSAAPASPHLRADSPEREDRNAAAYQRLRELIVSGKLAPGARLVEREIAARLGTSRTPVRSALQRLQQERYVVSLGGERARLAVAPLTSEDATELFEIVAVLEAAAARRAAMLDGAARARLVIELVEINDVLRRVTQRPNPQPDEVFALDTAFHRTYVERGAGPRMLALHDTIKPQAERYIRLYVSVLVDRIGESIREHEATIEAIRAGDPVATEQAVLTNWRNAAQRLAAMIARLGERGTW